MVAKNRVIVKILGQEYSLVSDDTREHMQRISNIVDDKMRELYDNNNKMSTSMVAVLTALNMTDDYLKALDEQKNILNRLDNPQKEVNSLSEELKKTKKYFNDSEMENLSLKKENEKLIETLKTYENTLLDLRIEIDETSRKCNEKIAEYEEALKKKDMELEEFINTFEKEKN